MRFDFLQQRRDSVRNKCRWPGYLPQQWFVEDPGLAFEDPRTALVRFSLLLEAKDRYYPLSKYRPHKHDSGPDLNQTLPNLWDFHGGWTSTDASAFIYVSSRER